MIVGIDLGTTNSLVAVINREGKPEIIINERGNRLTPSVVCFKNDEEVMVGELARSQLILKADRTVSCIKRYIGSDYQVNIFERGYTPTEVSALILRKLLQYAEKYLGKTIEAAVVTVPAYFNDNQRQATLMAGELAGIKILKLLNEPTAAALAYSSELDKQEHILVLDIGGGTFDITLMEYDDKVCRVLSSGGSSTLGGVDFDSRLVENILRTFQETTGIDLSGDLLALQQIQINAEKAKVDLSTVNECSVLIPYISMGATGPVHLNQVIFRDLYNHLCLDLFNDIRELIKQTLLKAEVDEKWVDVVVLAGGSSRMPGFRDLVRELFGEIEIKTEINPDEVVALGAALEAGMLSGEVDYVELHDVTSHTLGIEDDQGVFVPLIPVNTPYPVIESQLFTTVQDQQEEVIIHIMQREELGDSGGGNHVSLGKFHLEGIQQAQAGEPNIFVTFEIDRNGIFNVSAIDLDTGRQNQVQITEVSYSSGNQVSSSRGKNLIVL
ncbi:MAG: molecular chaperone DnaK [Firmicutes bacterium HGW-Firmicutes-15]|nr:MAG: molecular chaperone DnaK [Firmicutes bacterium HGW-Firmicutes-15]